MQILRIWFRKSISWRENRFNSCWSGADFRNLGKKSKVGTGTWGVDYHEIRIQNFRRARKSWMCSDRIRCLKKDWTAVFSKSFCLREELDEIEVELDVIFRQLEHAKESELSAQQEFTTVFRQSCIVFFLQFSTFFPQLLFFSPTVADIFPRPLLKPKP